MKRKFSRRHKLLLAAVLTDSTFQKTKLDGDEVWVGKCIHCDSKLVVDINGASRSAATIEHIQPRVQGGGDDLENLAVACARCNREKGQRHDFRGGHRLQEIVIALRNKRSLRWRNLPASFKGRF